MQLEYWLQIPGWEEDYEISNLGNIRECRRYICKHSGKDDDEKIVLTRPNKVKPRNSKTKINYKEVGLFRFDKKDIKYYLVHELVALTFVHNPNPEEYKYVIHLNSKLDDNRAANLMWSKYPDTTDSIDNIDDRTYKIINKLMNIEKSTSFYITGADKFNPCKYYIKFVFAEFGFTLQANYYSNIRHLEYDDKSLVETKDNRYSVFYEVPTHIRLNLLTSLLERLNYSNELKRIVENQVHDPFLDK